MMIMTAQSFARSPSRTTPAPAAQPTAPARVEATPAQAPRSLFQQLNSSWPEEIESQLKDQFQRPIINPQKSYVFIFAYAPKEPMDLRSGELLKQSVQNRLMNKSDGGHMMFGWQCQNPTSPNENFRFFKGMAAITGESSGQAVDLLRNGWGMNSYLASFTDGALQTPENLRTVIQNQIIQNRATFSFFLQEVTDQDCMKGLVFLNQFHLKPANTDPVQFRFGSMHDPGDAQAPGAGCLSFGYHFMKTVGLFPSAQPYFERTLTIPEWLLGYGRTDDQGRPLKKNEAGEDVVIPNVQIQTALTPDRRERISFHTLMNMRSWNPWGNERTLEIKQVDPELVYLFFRELGGEIAKKFNQAGYALTTNQQAHQNILNQLRHRRTIRGTDYQQDQFLREHLVETGFDNGYVLSNDPRFANNTSRGNSEALANESRKWVQDNFSVYKTYLIPFFHEYAIISVNHL